jgi:hypothetical protein
MGQAQSQSGEGNGCEGCFPAGIGYGIPGVGAPGVGVGIPGVGAPGVGVPGVGVPGVGVPGVGAPSIGVSPVGIPGPPVTGIYQQPVGVPSISIPSQLGIYQPGVPGVGVPSGVPGIGVPSGVPTVGVPSGVPGVGVPSGVPTVGVPSGVPIVGVPSGVPGVGVPSGVPTVGVGVGVGVGVPGGVPGIGVPSGVPTVGIPSGVLTVGVPSGVPGVGVPGVPGIAVPSGVPGVGVPGVPGIAVPSGVPSVGVPSVGIPSGVPGVGVPGVPGVGVPGGVPGVGLPGVVPGVGVPGGVPGVGLPVGVPGGIVGVGAPGGIAYQPGFYQQPGTGIPAQVGYTGGIYPYIGQDAYQALGYRAAGETQAESSVRQEDTETRAAASAQGKYGGGTAQTQVSGIYSGTGAFSAQAQTSDKDHGAQSQVVGGKEGATSTAQGQAGGGKTQSQVQLGSSSGATTAEAQSGGFSYGTNTQVQAGSQGGMADAQAKGQGSTSSQAQIGFTPYQKNSKTNGQKFPFHGGGSASAQSGAYSGQSQSHIQGSFQHGISYTGAAQAGSGQTSYRRTSSNYENFGGKLGLVQSGSRDGVPQNGGASISNGQQSGYQTFGSLSSSPSSSHTLSKQQAPDGGSTEQKVATLSGHSDQLKDYDDETTRQPDAYTGTEAESQPQHRQINNLGITRDGNGRVQQGGYRIQTHGARGNDTGHIGVPTQTQHIFIGPLNRHGAHIIQDSDDQDQYSPGDILQPGQTIHGTPEYTIPKGYRGRITSVAGPRKTAAQGGQSQTVILTPGVGNITYTGPSAGNYQPPVMSIPVSRQSVERNYDQSSQAGHVGSDNTQPRNGGQQPYSVRQNGGYFNQRNGRISRNGKHVRNGHSLNTYHHPTPDSFVTVTKSVTGQLDGGKSSNSTGKYTHTYYTKSSTCGYFTFSCNFVIGSNGRTKICKPNPPTNPDGTPCCC